MHNECQRPRGGFHKVKCRHDLRQVPFVDHGQNGWGVSGWGFSTPSALKFESVAVNNEGNGGVGETAEQDVWFVADAILQIFVGENLGNTINGKWGHCVRNGQAP